MSSNIQQFRDNFFRSGNIQRPTRYKVHMQGPGMPMLIIQPESVTVPGRELQIHRDEIWGPERPIPVKRTFNSAIITVFVMDTAWTARDYIEEWMNKLIPPGDEIEFNGNMRQPYEGIITDSSLMIDALDDRDIRRTRIDVIEPWPQTIMPLEMGYGIFNDYVRLQVSWAYRTYGY